jgi:hypothetical protein
MPSATHHDGLLAIGSLDGGHLLIGDLPELHFIVGYRSGQRFEAVVASCSVDECLIYPPA